MHRPKPRGGKLTTSKHNSYVSEQSDEVGFILGDEDERALRRAKHEAENKYTSEYSEDLVLTPRQ